MRFYLDGEMPPYLLAKDIILQVGFRVSRCKIQVIRSRAAACLHSRPCSMLSSSQPPTSALMRSAAAGARCLAAAL
jgi:hypothetical protein